MIACYKQNIHLLPFTDVFLKSLFFFAGGGDSSIGHYGGGGEIAQLIQNFFFVEPWLILEPNLERIISPSRVDQKCLSYNSHKWEFYFHAIPYNSLRTENCMKNL